MFDVRVSQEQLEYASYLVRNYDFGKRGRADGSQEQQRTGMIGQTVLADLLGLARPNGELGFDGGVDYIINGKRVDIKTMGRTVSLKNHYVHNFVGYQHKYEVDYYIFASLNKKTNILTFGGYIAKKDFDSVADFYNEGDWRVRDNGTRFRTKAPLYEIKQSSLHALDALEDIRTKII